MLGETYEADYPDKGLRFFSEKVFMRQESTKTVAFHPSSILLYNKEILEDDFHEAHLCSILFIF